MARSSLLRPDDDQLDDFYDYEDEYDDNDDDDDQYPPVPGQRPALSLVLRLVASIVMTISSF